MAKCCSPVAQDDIDHIDDFEMYQLSTDAIVVLQQFIQTAHTETMEKLSIQIECEVERCA